MPSSFFKCSVIRQCCQSITCKCQISGNLLHVGAYFVSLYGYIRQYIKCLVWTERSFPKTAYLLYCVHHTLFQRDFVYFCAHDFEFISVITYWSVKQLCVKQLRVARLKENLVRWSLQRKRKKNLGKHSQIYEWFLTAREELIDIS